MLLVSVLLIIAAIPFSANARGSGPVGFQTISVPNGSEPALRVAVWYPTDATPRDVPLESFKQLVAKDGRVTGGRLPLVVISHGGGGTLAGHYDTALALARAGFIVAALDHTGDTLGDESQVLKLWRRPRQLERLVTYMLDEWPDHGRIAPSRVGAFGFSECRAAGTMYARTDLRCVVFPAARHLAHRLVDRAGSSSGGPNLVISSSTILSDAAARLRSFTGTGSSPTGCRRDRQTPRPCRNSRPTVV